MMCHPVLSSDLEARGSRRRRRRSRGGRQEGMRPCQSQEGSRPSQGRPFTLFAGTGSKVFLLFAHSIIGGRSRSAGNVIDLGRIAPRARLSIFHRMRWAQLYEHCRGSGPTSNKPREIIKQYLFISFNGNCGYGSPY